MIVAIPSTAYDCVTFCSTDCRLPAVFDEDDPRYGWTWEHCRQDAVALLGSEDAVDAYIARALGNSDAPEPYRAADEQPFLLVAESAVKKNVIQPQFDFDQGTEK